MLRDGLSALIGGEDDMELSGTAGAADCAMQLFVALQPGITLIDLDLPNGIALIENIVATEPACCVIGLLSDEWDEVGRTALMAGAWSCVTKDRLAVELPVVIRRGCGRW